MSNYSDLLKNPKWQKKRLKIMERDGFKCQYCHNGDKTLNVHHIVYFQGKDPWEYENRFLITFCEDCHQKEHQMENEMGKLNISQYLRNLGMPNLFLGKFLKTIKSISGNDNYHEIIQRIITGPKPFVNKKETLRVHKKRKKPTKKENDLKTFKLCRKCNGQLVIRKPRGKIKSKQKYYFKSYFYCTDCKAMYMRESEKVFI